MKGFEFKPDHVKNAIRSSDEKALSAMGRKGAEAAQTNRDFDAAIKIDAAERLEKELYERALRENRHITPLDDEDPGVPPPTSL
jgi:hypothetical protein